MARIDFYGMDIHTLRIKINMARNILLQLYQGEHSVRFLEKKGSGKENGILSLFLADTPSRH